VPFFDSKLGKGKGNEWLWWLGKRTGFMVDVVLGCLQISFYSFPPFVSKQKVEPKVQGRRNGSACPSRPAHNSLSLLVSSSHFVISLSPLVTASLLFFFAYVSLAALVVRDCRRCIALFFLYSREAGPMRNKALNFQNSES
jgi:hypothetical protein